MPLKRFIVLSFALGSIRLACADNLTTFKVTEPISIAGVPLVKLGPGSYVLRTIHESGGARVVQVLSKRQDYLYTTVLTIPAERPHADDNHANPLFRGAVRASAGAALLVSGGEDLGL